MSEPPDLETLARRYLDLWQDQVSALAADPEFTETFGRLLQVSASLGPAGWMSLWTAAAAGLKPQKANDASSAQRPVAAPPPAAWPAPAAAAHRDGGNDVAELRRRLAALEKRLVELDRRDANGAGNTATGSGNDVGVAHEGAVAQDAPRAGRRPAPRAGRRRP